MKAKIETNKREMINRWATNLPQRIAILKFWEWLANLEQHEGGSNYIDEIDIEKMLDRYFEIDRKQLDDERRAMLE